MIPPLDEILGLPPDAAPYEFASAADRCYETLFGRAGSGDANAQRDLVQFHVAYLLWAYADRKSRNRD